MQTVPGARCGAPTTTTELAVAGRVCRQQSAQLHADGRVEQTCQTATEAEVVVARRADDRMVPANRDGRPKSSAKSSLAVPAASDTVVRPMKSPLLQVAIALSLMGCTVFSSQQRHTLDWLDRNLTPGSSGVREALLPVAIPVGVIGLASDALVVNPAMAIDDAWRDTVELLWSAQDETSMRRALFAPLAAVATPVVFASDWLWRSLWPLEPRREEQ